MDQVFPFLDDEAVSAIDEESTTFQNLLILGKQVAYGRRSSCCQFPFSNNRTFTNLIYSFSQMQSQDLNSKSMNST